MSIEIQFEFTSRQSRIIIIIINNIHAWYNNIDVKKSMAKKKNVQSDWSILHDSPSGEG